MWPDLGEPPALREECLSKPPDDARFVQIVGGHLHFDPVADRQPDPALAHLSADGGQNEVLVVELHPERKQFQLEPPAGRVVAILSGGNVDPERYDQLLARGLAAGG